MKGSARVGLVIVSRRLLGDSFLSPSLSLRALVAMAASAACLFLCLALLLPLGTAIQIGADEGFELAKATLCLEGYRLYEEVWNDQPPLLTFVVTQAIQHTSYSILVPRLITVGFSLLLLASLAFAADRLHGTFVALLTTCLLIGSPAFLELSASCMQEVPSLAAGVAALCPLLLPREWVRRSIGLVAAGVVFGLAIQIKLTAAITLPLAALLIATHEPMAVCCPAFRQLGRSRPAKAGTTNQARFMAPIRDSRIVETFHESDAALPRLEHFIGPGRALLLLSAGMAAGFGVVHFSLGGNAYFHQLWISHFAAARSIEYGSAAEHPFDWAGLLRNWDALLPALLGILTAVTKWRSAPGGMIPVVWLVLALSVFTLHRPWWAYYYIHISIPLCWCAAIGWERAARHVLANRGSRRSRPTRAATLAFAGAALLWMVLRVHVEVADARRLPRIDTCLALDEIERLRPRVRWLYAAEPIYSFHAGIPMPPQLAILSLKRFWSGDMTNARLGEEMGRMKPEVVLLPNNGRATPLTPLLQAQYRLIYEDASLCLYAHRAALEKAGW